MMFAKAVENPQKGWCKDCRRYRTLSYRLETEDLICVDCLQKLKNMKIVDHVYPLAPTPPKPEPVRKKRVRKNAIAQPKQRLISPCVLEIVKKSDRALSAQQIWEIDRSMRRSSVFNAVNTLVEQRQLACLGVYNRRFVDIEREHLLYQIDDTHLGQIIAVLHNSEVALTVDQIAIAHGICYETTLYNLRKIDTESWAKPDCDRCVYYAIKSNQKALEHLEYLKATSTEEQIVKIVEEHNGVYPKEVIRRLGRHPEKGTHWIYKLMKNMAANGRIAAIKKKYGNLYYPLNTGVQS